MSQKAVPALVTRLIDYAGLFPPARLDMGPAVEEYARGRLSDAAFMLSRFVVPVGRLDAFEKAAAAYLHGDEQGGEGPWTLSVLAGGEPVADRARIDAFNAAHGPRGSGRAVVASVELQAAAPADVERQIAFFADFEAYFEISHREDPSALLSAIARSGGRAKIRTGGITADAMPSSAEVARFLAAAEREGVAFKATAGLHHPLRGEYRLTYEPRSDRGTMHGFLNLFLAAAFLRQTDLAEREIPALLEERDAAAFVFSEDGVRWQDHALSAAELAATREGFATSYGSCSFREPVDELRELHLL